MLAMTSQQWFGKPNQSQIYSSADPQLLPACQETRYHLKVYLVAISAWQEGFHRLRPTDLAFIFLKVHVVFRCGYIFHFQWIFSHNGVVSIGIQAIGNLAWGRKMIQCRFCLWFRLVMWICRIDQYKAAWFKRDFSVSCGSYIPIHSCRLHYWQQTKDPFYHKIVGPSFMCSVYSRWILNYWCSLYA